MQASKKVDLEGESPSDVTPPAESLRHCEDVLFALQANFVLCEKPELRKVCGQSDHVTQTVQSRFSGSLGVAFSPSGTPRRMDDRLMLKCHLFSSFSL